MVTLSAPWTTHGIAAAFSILFLPIRASNSKKINTCLCTYTCALCRQQLEDLLFNGVDEEVLRKPKVETVASKREDHRLRIVEDARKGTLVQGLEEVLVRDAKEVCPLLLVLLLVLVFGVGVWCWCLGWFYCCF